MNDPVEAAFCLCGAKRCRASYLAFVGEQGNNHVLRRCHRLVERQAALLAAGDATGTPSDHAVAAMAEVGLKIGRGLLRDAPPWLAHFVGHVARFMRRELARLPRDILAEHRATTAKEVKKANGKWIPPPFGLGDAEIEALSVRENRLQSMAICLSRCATSSGAGPSARRSPTRRRPRLPLDERDAARFFGTGRDSMLQNLVACMAPHARHGEDAVAHAAFVSEAEQVAREVRRGAGAEYVRGDAKDDAKDDDDDAKDAKDANSDGSPSPRRSVREGLLWLRDRLASMPPTRGARHDVAAELVHMHAHTRRYWVNSAHVAHAALRADPIEVRENEVNSYGIGAEGASEKIVQSVERTYKPGTVSGSLLMWYKQDIGDPVQWVQSNRRASSRSRICRARVQLAPGDFRREGDAAREGDVAGAPRRDAGPTVADEQRAVGGVERATRARIADVGRLRRRARKRVGDGERGRADGEGARPRWTPPCSRGSSTENRSGRERERERRRE